MVYSDLLFLLGLFPLSAILSYLDRSAEYKNLILILTSVLFFSWGRPFAVCLIFLSCAVDWLLGMVISKNVENRILSGLLTVLDGAFNIGLFLVFGHNYLFDSVKALSFESYVLPLGMGYYCIRGFSYVYDIFMGRAEYEKNIFCLLTYMVSFHFLMAGPHVSYSKLEPQIRHRDIDGRKLNDGLVELVLGLGKIVILAPVFERIKLAGLNGREITTIGCWLGMMAFFAEAYFTFTGLCDMAKGLGLINGFEYPDNYTDIEADGLFTGMVKSYNSTVVEFFSDVFACRRVQNPILKFVLILVCGVFISMWYEAKLSFLIVGAAAALLIAVERLFLAKPLGKLPAAVKYLYLVITAMVIFGGLYFDSLYGYKKWLLALVNVNTKYMLSVSVKYAVLKNITLIAIAFFIAFAPAKKLVLGLWKEFSRRSRRCYGITKIIQTILTAFIFVLSIVTLAVETAA
ncbi:MAG: acyltransferase [Ruminococcus sp.]|nr:acyltransferase [Ruminococcus sp.]